MSKALVVLSGGQDSTTCLALSVEPDVYDEVHTISFDYGQRHAIELQSARVVSAMLGAKSHVEVNVKGLLRSTSPLLDHQTPVEAYTGPDEMEQIIGTRIEHTFVPLRNPFFLLVAANHAVSLGANTLVTGVCAMDNANYPDCTDAFLTAMTTMIREALGQHRTDHTGPLFNIVAPLLYLTKGQSVKLAQKTPGAMDALAYSHTCYNGQVPPCGVCHACILRAEGFARAGVADPLVQRTDRRRRAG